MLDDFRQLLIFSLFLPALALFEVGDIFEATVDAIRDSRGDGNPRLDGRDLEASFGEDGVPQPEDPWLFLGCLGEVRVLVANLVLVALAIFGDTGVSLEATCDGT